MHRLIERDLGMTKTQVNKCNILRNEKLSCTKNSFVFNNS